MHCSFVASHYSGDEEIKACQPVFIVGVFGCAAEILRGRVLIEQLQTSMGVGLSWSS